MPDRVTLTPERFAKVRAVFEAAVERPEGERRAFAAGACAGDRALLREVEQMLAGEEQTQALLDQPDPASAPITSVHEEGRFPAGTVLAGRYRILGLLGKGGMGEVYRAHDLILNQVVALKFLTASGFGEAALVRFRNEVRIARQVSHPNVCRVYDLGMVEGLHFLSMEYIDGEDLASLLRRIGRLPQDKAMEFTRKICAGLAAAHDRGVLHRDLKPANIMIDGRGQPRITDFGLAGLAAEIPLSDLRSGTPAYMSPEQKSGKEVTTRSDIYSLGLVLHEMFTGKQRGSGSSTSPSDFVKDLDPAIERLILRCLEEDPKRRPSAAFNVAMALPGADPIAAALAAGETPSPEMVAASQEKEGFSVRTAVLCFAALLALLGVATVVQSRIGLSAQAPMKHPPEGMADRVQQMLRSIGYTEEPASTKYGYVCCLNSVMAYVAALPEAERKIAVAAHRPAIAAFYYEQTQKSGFASPPGGFPGDTDSAAKQIRVTYDPDARLIRLEADHGVILPQTEPIDWNILFAAAGLDMDRFTPVTPDVHVAVPVNQQFAWEGDWGADRKERIRVEAGLRGGRVAVFQVIPEIPEPSDGIGGPFPLGAFLAVVGVSAVFAVRNMRQGRSDRKGGYVILGIAGVFGLGAGLLGPGHIPSSNEALYALILTCWLMYLATEPFVRRNWPDALISWSRFCSGKIQNALVASHVLAGVTIAVLWGAAVFRVAEFMDGSPFAVVGVNALSISYLGSVGTAIGGSLGRALTGVAAGLLFVVLVTLLRLMIRKLWVADVLACVIQASLILAGYPYGPMMYAVTIVTWLGDMWLLRRFGLFAFLVGWVVQTMVVSVPVVTTGWIASQSLMIHLVPVVLGSWALWVILTDKRAGEVSTETAA